MRLEERFWSKVDRRGPDECWPWLASIRPNGYGQFRLDGRPQQAHRVAYLLAVAEIPHGLDLDHLCRNRACVNPAHLEPVTRRENARRGIKGVLTTHCPHGHPYDAANTHITRNGWRMCRTCNRIRVARHRNTMSGRA